MTESINIGFEMLQFISCQIISKQTVTISGNPNYITRIMNYVVTFLIYIIYFISRNQLERIDKSGLGVDIPYLTCMIINPEIPPVVNLNLSSCYIQFRIPAHLMSSQIKDITAIFRKNDPIVLQAHGTIYFTTFT